MADGPSRDAVRRTPIGCVHWTFVVLIAFVSFAGYHWLTWLHPFVVSERMFGDDYLPEDATCETWRPDHSLPDGQSECRDCEFDTWLYHYVVRQVRVRAGGERIVVHNRGTDAALHFWPTCILVGSISTAFLGSWYFAIASLRKRRRLR